MPVDTPHCDYLEHAPVWKMMRDCLAGSRAIKAAGELYLPRLFEQPDPGYADYKLRAMWYGATSRTAEGFQGMLTRKDPVVTAPGAEALVEDCDLQGNPFSAHAESVLWELIQVARCGTLVDYSTEAARPYVTTYKAEEIINWRAERIGGKMVCTLVVLFELATDYQAVTGDAVTDEYSTKVYEQWREVRLVNAPAQSDDATVVTSAPVTSVVQKVWRRQLANGTKASRKANSQPADKGTNGFVLISTTTLTRRGEALTEVPFVMHGMEANRYRISKPILLDCAELNIGDYRNSADEENAIHIAGLPTPWAAGFVDDTNTTLALGTSKAWVTTDPTAQCGFLEYTGAGVQSIQAAKSEKRQAMAALGARVLDSNPSKAAESTDTVKLRQTGESNVLTDLACSAEQSLSDVLRWLVWWNGTVAKREDLQKTVFVAINKDLLGSKLDSATMTALFAGFQANSISFDTLFWNMQQGNMYPDGTTSEKEKTAIQQNPPPPALPAPGGNPEPGAKPPGNAGGA